MFPANSSLILTEESLVPSFFLSDYLEKRGFFFSHPPTHRINVATYEEDERAYGRGGE